MSSSISLAQLFLATILLSPICSVIAQQPNSDIEQNQLDETFLELRKKVETEVMNLHREANNTGSGNRNNVTGTVISADVITFNDIPPEVNRRIESQQLAIQRLIEAVARSHETTNSTVAIGVSEQGIEIPRELLEQMEQIEEAGAANNRTIMTVYFTSWIQFRSA